MRLLGWVLAFAIAASIAVAGWAGFLADRSDSKFIRDTAVLFALLFVVALGAVEHFERKRNV